MSGRAKLRARDVGLWRLVAHRVVAPCADAGEAVGVLAAVQAQDLRGAVTAIDVRVRGDGVASLREAMASGRVVRSWPMRGTLHLIGAADLRPVLSLTGARTIASIRRRYADLALDDQTFDRAREIAVEVLGGGRRMTRPELLEAWRHRGVSTDGQRGVHLLQRFCLEAVLCLGPSRGREQEVVLVEEWIPEQSLGDPEEILREWVRRFLAGHGPASVRDVVWWTKLPLTAVRTAVEGLRDDLEVLDVDGAEFFADPGLGEQVTAVRSAARGTWLLPGFDEFLLGYADRSHVLDPGSFEQVVPGGNGVFRGIVVTAGRVVGTWTRSGPEIDVVPLVGSTAPGVTAERALAARRAALSPGWLDGST